MIWEELSLDRVIGDSVLVAAFSELFDVAPDAVRIVDTIEAAPPPSDRTTRLVVERWVVGGEFPLQLTVYPRDVALPADRLAAVRQVCARLCGSCLVADDSPNPLSWLRVGTDGTVESVTIDADALDRDEFVVVEVRRGRRSRSVA